MAGKNAKRASGYKWVVACDVCSNQRWTASPSRHCMVHMTKDEKDGRNEYDDKRVTPRTADKGYDVTKYLKLKNHCTGAAASFPRNARSITTGAACASSARRNWPRRRRAPGKRRCSSRRREDVCMKKLIPLCGTRTSRATRSRTCSARTRTSAASRLGRPRRPVTAAVRHPTKRRPDIIYFVRDEVTARLLLVITVEIDEDSHASRETKCELGKIDDTFEAIGTLGQREGFRDDRAGHNREDIRRPLMVTFKLNPNGYDAC